MMKPTILAGSLMVAFALACNSATGSRAPGLLTLVSVDGAPLPFAGPTTITVRGSLDLEGSGKFTLLQSDSSIFGAVLTQFNATGTFALTDNALVLTGGPVLYLGVVASLGDSINLTFGAHHNLYVRR